MRAALLKGSGALVLVAAALVAPASAAQAGDGAFISGHDGRCLDSDVAGPTHDGTKVQVWQCNGWKNQSWSVGPNGTLRSLQDGRCLDEDIAGGTRNGTKVQVWDCNGQDNQQWHQ